MEYRIQYVNRKIKGGYIGMNSEASKQLNIPFKHKRPKHTIVIYKKVPHSVREATIRHEQAEKYFVKEKHLNRKMSHYNALRFENVNKPFPKKNIKKELKKMGFKIKR